VTSSFRKVGRGFNSQRLPVLSSWSRVQFQATTKFDEEFNS
jgi:hypothetical protein